MGKVRRVLKRNNFKKERSEIVFSGLAQRLKRSSLMTSGQIDKWDEVGDGFLSRMKPGLFASKLWHGIPNGKHEIDATITI